VVLLLAMGALANAGCARTGARPAGAGETAPSRPAPAAPQAASGEAPSPGGAPAALNPGEVMTAAELATIPDPVPPAGAGSGTAPSDTVPSGGSGAAGAPGDSARLPAGNGGSGGSVRDDPSPGAPGGASEAPPEGAVWRVQIFASPDLGQADRVAKEAAGKLGASYVIRYAESLYRVRLGAFRSEEEAGSLRDRAIRAGYPGAFRVRARAEASGGSN
jgi:hypothetical protein